MLEIGANLYTAVLCARQDEGGLYYIISSFWRISWKHLRSFIS